MPVGEQDDKDCQTMIRCSTRKFVVDCFEEAGKPLSKKIKTDLLKVESDLIQEKLSLAFIVFFGKCRICNYRVCIIGPEVTGSTEDFKCSNCGNMTVQEEDEREWWQ